MKADVWVMNEKGKRWDAVACCAGNAEVFDILVRWDKSPSIRD